MQTFLRSPWVRVVGSVLGRRVRLYRYDSHPVHVHGYVIRRYPSRTHRCRRSGGSVARGCVLEGRFSFGASIGLFFGEGASIRVHPNPSHVYSYPPRLSPMHPFRATPLTYIYVCIVQVVPTPLSITCVMFKCIILLCIMCMQVRKPWQCCLTNLQIFGQIHIRPRSSIVSMTVL